MAKKLSTKTKAASMDDVTDVLVTTSSGVTSISKANLIPSQANGINSKKISPVTVGELLTALRESISMKNNGTSIYAGCGYGFLTHLNDADYTIPTNDTTMSFTQLSTGGAGAAVWAVCSPYFLDHGVYLLLVSASSASAVKLTTTDVTQAQ